MLKKSDNIAEYILHTWQMEDCIRAFRDNEQLMQNPDLLELRTMMEQEGKMEKGHVQLTEVAIDEMTELHNELYQQDAAYRAAWMQVMPAMTRLKSKTDRPTMSDMEICLTFLYEIMLLRLQNKEISAETTATQQQVSSLLRHIAMAYYADRHPQTEE